MVIFQNNKCGLGKSYLNVNTKRYDYKTKIKSGRKISRSVNDRLMEALFGLVNDWKTLSSIIKNPDQMYEDYYPLELRQRIDNTFSLLEDRWDHREFPIIKKSEWSQMYYMYTNYGKFGK